MPLDKVQRQDPSPAPTPKGGKRGEDQRPGESIRDYEMRKALEASASGDTRKYKDRF